MLVELRDALHLHIERLRASLADYPFIVERRVRNAILPPGITAPQDAVSKNRPTSALETSSANGEVP
jgi:hypothetical protein